MLRSIVTAVLLALGMTAATSAADNQNAATWYAKAVEKVSALPEEQIQAMLEFAVSEPGAELSPDARLGLARMQEAFQLAGRGAQQERCDYQLDFSQGFDMLLPHVSQARQFARLMRADAVARLREGDSAGAADRLASIYRMADHSCDDGILISSLVGAAMFNSADKAVQSAIDRGQFAATDAAALLQAARLLPADDPFEFVEAVAGEQEIMVDWISQKFAGEDGAARFAEAIGGMGAIDELAEEVAAVNEDEFQAMLGQTDALMDRVVGAFLLEDRAQATEAMQQIHQEIEAGEHGLLAMMLLPAYGKVLTSKFYAVDMVAARVRSLEAIVKGQVTPEEAANAAVWYLRGIEMMEALPRETRATIRTAGAVATPPADGASAAELDDETIAALLEAQPIIDVFREGSLKQRCDFTFARPFPETLVRSYVGGMREAARLLEADARRAQSAMDAAAFVDRLAVALRMSAHLAEDHAIVSSLTSHTMFERAAKLAIESEFAARLLPEEKSILASAVESMSRKDPFGYLEAIASDRAFAVRMMNCLPPAPALETEEPARDSADHPTPEHIAQGWDADRLLQMAIVLDAFLNTPAPPTVPAEVGALPALRPWRLLDDVLALPELDRARAQGTRLKSAPPGDGLKTLNGLEPLVICRVVERMAAARADLRLAITLLTPSAHPAATPP